MFWSRNGWFQLLHFIFKLAFFFHQQLIFNDFASRFSNLCSIWVFVCCNLEFVQIIAWLFLRSASLFWLSLPSHIPMHYSFQVFYLQVTIVKIFVQIGKHEIWKPCHWSSVTGFFFPHSIAYHLFAFAFISVSFFLADKKSDKARGLLAVGLKTFWNRCLQRSSTCCIKDFMVWIHLPSEPTSM